MPPEENDDFVSETVHFENKPEAEAKPDAPEENALASAAPEGDKPEAQDAETDAADAAPAETAEAEEAPEEPAEPKPIKGNAWQKRVDKLTKSVHEERRRAEALEAERDLYRRMANGEDVQSPQNGQQQPAQPQGQPRQPVPQYGTQEFQSAVQQEAARIAAQTTFETRFQGWEAEGLKDYPDFRDRCETLASLGAAENPDFVPALLDIDNGAKVAAKLAQDPDAATRILALPRTRMISELTKMGLEAGKPKSKPVSKAPAPIKPIDGTAQVTDEILPDDSEETMYRKWEAADRKKRMQRYGNL